MGYTDPVSIQRLHDRAQAAGVSVEHISGCMACVTPYNNVPYDRLGRLIAVEQLLGAGLEPILSNVDGSIIVRMT